MSQLTALTVYRTEGEHQISKQGNAGAATGSIQIKAITATTTVKVYESNELIKPANIAAMTESDSFGEGVYPYGNPARWIAFEVTQGTAEIYEFQLTAVDQS